MQYRCRWCDRRLSGADSECDECLEGELERRVGQRSHPEVLWPILEELLTLIDLGEERAEIEAYNVAVQDRRGVRAAYEQLRARLGTGADGDSDEPSTEELPGSAEANLADARSELLEAILAYPFDYERSLHYAARAVARLMAWAAARSVVPAGPSPVTTPEAPAFGEFALLDWVERRARQSAWRAAFQEALAVAEENLFARFLGELRRGIDTLRQSPARAA